jgi:hypothetical protein
VKSGTLLNVPYGSPHGGPGWWAGIDCFWKRAARFCAEQDIRFVSSSSSPKQAIDKFLAGDFDLVMLCHSILADDRERLDRLIRQYTERTPLVSVSSFDGEYDSFAGAVIENDPAVFISGLREVLSSNHSRNK